jgi:hypothetical protein
MKASLSDQKDRSTEDHSLFKAERDKVPLPVFPLPRDPSKADQPRSRKRGLFHMDWCDPTEDLATVEPTALTRTEDEPKPTIDGSAIEALRPEHLWANAYECLDYNKQAEVEFYEHRNLKDAYRQLKKGMLGNGENDYSKLLTQYFEECLENFCKFLAVNDSVEKFKSWIDDLSRVVILPEYSLLRLVLSDLIQKSITDGNVTETIELQKEAIFLIMLEGTQNDQFGEVSGYLDYDMSLERRISKDITKLRCFMEESKAMDSGRNYK